MEKKTLPGSATSNELPFHRLPLSQCILGAKDDVENCPSAVTFRSSWHHANIAEGEAAPSSALNLQIKFILQDCRTGKFIRCDSMWSDDIHEALDFLSARRAVFYGMKELKAEFHILQIGQTGLVSTATIKMGLLKWSKTPKAAYVAEAEIVAANGKGSLIHIQLKRPFCEIPRNDLLSFPNLKRGPKAGPTGVSLSHIKTLI
jgi:hypothetical protein